MRFTSLRAAIAGAIAAGGLILGTPSQAAEPQVVLNSVTIQYKTFESELDICSAVPQFQHKQSIPFFMEKLDHAKLADLIRTYERLSPTTKEQVKRVVIVSQSRFDRMFPPLQRNRAVSTQYNDIVLVDPIGLEGLPHEAAHLVYNNLNTVFPELKNGKTAQERFNEEWLAIAKINYGTLIKMVKSNVTVWKDCPYDEIETLEKKCAELRPKIDALALISDDTSKAIDVRMAAYNEKQPIVKEHNDIAAESNKRWQFGFRPNEGCFSAYASVGLDEDVAEAARFIVQGGEAIKASLNGKDSRFKKKAECLVRYKFLTEEVYKAARR